MGMENPCICRGSGYLYREYKGDTYRGSRLARLTSGALETLGTLEDKERGVGLEEQGPANLSFSLRNLGTNFLPSSQSSLQKTKAQVYDDTLDTHRCARGARETTRTRRTLQKKKKGRSQ